MSMKFPKRNSFPRLFLFFDSKDSRSEPTYPSTTERKVDEYYSSSLAIDYELPQCIISAAEQTL